MYSCKRDALGDDSGYVPISVGRKIGWLLCIDEFYILLLSKKVRILLHCGHQSKTSILRTFGQISKSVLPPSLVSIYSCIGQAFLVLFRARQRLNEAPYVLVSLDSQCHNHRVRSEHWIPASKL